MSQTQSKSQDLSVHLHVYRGERVAYDENNKCLTENNIVKIHPHGGIQWGLFLQNAMANGFCKIVVEKVLDMTDKNNPVEVEDLKPFQEEVNNVAGYSKKKVKTQDEIIAELQEQNKQMMEAIAKMQGGGTVTSVSTPSMIKESEFHDELATLRQEYMDITGEQGDKRWGVETLQQKIEELKK